MATTTKEPEHDAGKQAECMETADFLRLKYFYGQMLTASDFQTEQDFFREKLKLHNRCLHGYGVVCGLRVEPVPIPPDCDDKHREEYHSLKQKLTDLLQKKAAASPDSQPQPAAAPSPTAETPAPAPAPPTAPTPAPAPAVAPPASPAATSAPVPQPTNAPQAPVTPPAAATPAPTENLDAEIEEVRRALSKLHKECCHEEPKTKVHIDCGLAIDCEGNELVVRKPLTVDLLAALDSQSAYLVKHGVHSLYLSICYCEKDVDPVRPVFPEACGASMDSAFGKVRESVRIQVSLDPPPKDHRCEPCCEACKSCCLLLARIDCFVPGHEIQPHHIHNEVQRPISLYEPTTITGVSWKHGHTYTQEEARELLGTDDEHSEHHDGLEIRFSKPVRASTIRRGVLDVWVVEGGRGRSGNIYNKAGKFVHKQDHGFVERIRFRDTTEETLEPGDRVIITLRTDFILDRCCRSVDGENTGGRVPQLPEFAHRFRHHAAGEEHHEHEHEGEHHPHAEECCHPPGRPGPWTSGNRIPGGIFESWFFIREDENDRDRRKSK
ncbi:MAG TPA: hypothetical protein VKT53_14650 [Candidatus Acidoferrum sp.]|nr:hypothetical protein [Candidatus Acidoferrum sp.]